VARPVPYRTRPEAKRKGALPNRFTVPELPANWKVLVGMAGLLAEEILNAEPDDVSAMARNMFFRISDAEVSDSDLAPMRVTDIDSRKLSYEIVELAVPVLREKWAACRKRWSI
jgi:hypothetical protein